MSQQISSFLRYPGGKRRMLLFLRDHLPTPERIEGRYIEPFVGGGSVFFHIQPKKALLSDANQDLINIYRGIRYAPREVWAAYRKFGNTKRDYKHVRDCATGETLVQRAARMLYLNRTCFKGMWRHNRLGEFNVGYGGQARRWVISENDLLLTCKLLRKATIRCSDFESIVDSATQDDFLFLDPPYRPGDCGYSNNHYLWQKFSLEDHQRLALAIRRARHRGVAWAMTTSSHEDITKLFRGYYALDIPRGTGRLPGITAINSGEVFVSSYKTEGGKRL
jgi:DNA adenine methylase